jgi:hypothetical protein
LAASEVEGPAAVVPVEIFEGQECK